MEKDLSVIQRSGSSNEFYFESSGSHNSVIVCFRNIDKCTPRSIPLPSTFLIEVPKYYPHERPVVKCLDGGVRSPFISEQTGLVIHSQLCELWVATFSLSEVLSVLKSVRHLAGEESNNGTMTVES